MEQDLTDRDQEPDWDAAAAARVAEPAQEEAVVPGEAAAAGSAGEPARVPDSRARAWDRAGESAEGEETPPRAGETDEGADSAEMHVNREAEDGKMPGMDGTGPMGSGPRGWGRGPCGGGQGRGRGMGAGNRFGQGGWFDPRLRGNWFSRLWGRQYPGSEPAADRAALEEQVRMLESDLQAARKQLDAMGPAAKEE